PLTVEVTDAITLDLFLKTKNANHFNVYQKNVGSGVHYVEVKVDSLVSSDPNAPADPGTRAVAGKRSFVIEEYNNPQQVAPTRAPREVGARVFQRERREGTTMKQLRSILLLLAFVTRTLWSALPALRLP